MPKAQQFDFSGWATKVGVKCSDGRTILKDAFKHNDGQKVPLVWQHLHNDPMNILGHAILENRPEGVYARCKFNNSEAGKNAKEAVKHGDITMMSIYANELKQRGNDVLHGNIRELSLVLAGANPEAKIENLTFAHGDGTENEVDDEVIIYTGLTLSHSDDPVAEKKDDVAHADSEDGETVAEIFDSLNDKQKTVVYAMMAKVIEEAGTAKHSDIEEEEEGEEVMKHNVFDDADKQTPARRHLTRDQLTTIMEDAQKCGSYKQAFLAHAVEYGIENIDILFPDAKAVTPTPDLITRNMDWVPRVLNGATHTPFSRIKSTSADLTLDTARAKGYVKATLKKEEFFALSKRITTPTTVYKKQKLDRDDIVDITDLDVVAFLKMEMRMMLDEELAVAALLGDGREADAEDKINETNIRPIYTDDDFYAHHVKLAAATTTEELIEAVIRARKNYKGSGNPDFFTSTDIFTDMLLLKDSLGRRLYRNKAELASELLVNDIIEVPQIEERTRKIGAPGFEKDYSLVGIVVNMKDYKYGADKGGNVSMFDDFDIDYNQYKYLIETRCSGALTKPKSALVIELEEAAAG